jgi:UDP-N-acetylmuramoyl-tripeptide--D-alanyl-D-alanine ligase
MQELTWKKIHNWLGMPVPDSDMVFTGVSTDTRTIKAGELFIALQGPQFDGHDFIAAASQAAAALIMRPVTSSLPILQVADTRLALGKVAAAFRQQFTLPVIAITGSNGKTTLKEMIANILAQQGPVLATQGNLNNDIGVPLTLLKLTAAHYFAVIEMGANHPGEIAYTTQLAQPMVAVINNVAPAHLQGFLSLAGVASAKGEIYQGLTTEGTAIVNADDQFASFWQQSLPNRKTIRFGLQNSAEVYASDLQPDSTGRYSFLLHTPAGEITITLSLPGKHNVMNALAATAAVLALAIPLAAIKKGLETVKPVKGRLISQPGLNGINLIDDTYNANPGSVKAALEFLASCQGQRIFVLGDLAELGQDAVAYHHTIGEQAKALGIDRFYACGPLSRSAVTAFGQGGEHFPDQPTLIAALREIAQPNTTILIKGSRSAKMEEVVLRLTI